MIFFREWKLTGGKVSDKVVRGYLILVRVSFAFLNEGLMQKFMRTLFFVVVMLIAGYYIVQLVLVISPGSNTFAPR